MYASVGSCGVNEGVFMYGINKGAFICLYAHLLDGINKGVLLICVYVRINLVVRC